MKECRICKVQKDLCRFRRNGKICRKCANARNKENLNRYNEENKEVIKTRLKEYRKEYKHSDAYKRNKSKQRKKGIETLSRSYVYTTLYSRGFRKEDITDELIELQTIILKTKRLCKTLKN